MNNKKKRLAKRGGIFDSRALWNHHLHLTGEKLKVLEPRALSKVMLRVED
jgi:hypothetical protein